MNGIRTKSMLNCFKCGEKAVFITGNASAEDCGYIDDGMVDFYTCQNCGAEYEVFQPFPEEEEENENEQNV